MIRDALFDPRFLQALVAGAVVALGWIVNGWQNRRAAIRDAAHVRRIAGRARAERVRDVHRALYAEIGAYLQSIGGLEALRDGRGRMVERMKADPGFVPFLPHDEPDRLYRAIIGEIHVLPRTSIDVVVAFYGQVGAIRALIDDMRGDRFASLPPERRQAIYEDYIRLKETALIYGEAALTLIDAYARGGKALAEETLAALRARGWPGAEA